MIALLTLCLLFKLQPPLISLMIHHGAQHYPPFVSIALPEQGPAMYRGFLSGFHEWLEVQPQPLSPNPHQAGFWHGSWPPGNGQAYSPIHPGSRFRNRIQPFRKIELEKLI